MNIAARLESAATPGRIYVGPKAAREIDYEGLSAVGELSLKGIKQPD